MLAGASARYQLSGRPWTFAIASRSTSVTSFRPFSRLATIERVQPSPV